MAAVVVTPVERNSGNLDSMYSEGRCECWVAAGHAGQW